MIVRVGRGPEGADGAWLTYYDKFDNGVLGTFLGCVDLDEVQRTSQHSELGPGVFEVDTAGPKPRVYFFRCDDGVADAEAERDAWLSAVNAAAAAGRARAASRQ